MPEIVEQQPTPHSSVARTLWEVLTWILLGLSVAYTALHVVLTVWNISYLGRMSDLPERLTLDDLENLEGASGLENALFLGASLATAGFLTAWFAWHLATTSILKRNGLTTKEVFRHWTVHSGRIAILVCLILVCMTRPSFDIDYENLTVGKASFVDLATVVTLNGLGRLLAGAFFVAATVVLRKRIRQIWTQHLASQEVAAGLQDWRSVRRF